MGFFTVCQIGMKGAKKIFSGKPKMCSFVYNNFLVDYVQLTLLLEAVCQPCRNIVSISLKLGLFFIDEAKLKVLFQLIVYNEPKNYCTEICNHGLATKNNLVPFIQKNLTQIWQSNMCTYF
jgi:hypothetical protein